MIRFSLVCEVGHTFESWFSSGAAYDHQTGNGLVVCPVCGSSKVIKAIMAPALSSSRGKVIDHEELSAPPRAAAPEDAPPALLDSQHRDLRAVIGSVRAQILADTIDVGKSFPEEARKMHDGESPERPIRGEATAAEVHALIEDGVKIMPIPAAPEDLN
jgi:hypothetical protein